MSSRAGRWVGVVVNAPAAPAVGLLCGLVFLFKPMQVFEGNAPFFFFSAAQFGLVLVPMFLATAGALVWLASRGSERVRHVLAAALAGVALAGWVNSTFVSTAGGILDGRTMLRMADARGAFFNALLWASVAAVAAALAYSQMQLVRRFLVALFVVLAAHCAWIAIADDHPWRAAPEPSRLANFSPTGTCSSSF